MTQWIDKARRVLENYISTGDDDHTVSFLQALIDHAPTDSGRRSICESILKCIEKVDKDHSLSDLLYKLREHYLTGMIYPMRAKGGKTPKVTEHPSRKDSMEQETMLNEAYLSAAKRDRKKLKNLALLRDDYRSVISGEADLGTADARGVPPDVGVVATEAAHILPFSLATNLQEKAGLWTVLSSFSGWDVAMIIGGDEINRLGNVFTLATYEHDAFGQLSWWLEKVEHLSRQLDHATEKFHRAQRHGDDSRLQAEATAQQLREAYDQGLKERSVTSDKAEEVRRMVAEVEAQIIEYVAKEERLLNDMLSAYSVFRDRTEHYIDNLTKRLSLKTVAQQPS
ncbi:hypothetical protein RSOLAG22IIIB_06394 [Rhizoctonia solani]|uniref:HNH nuclease domain-containing protein n=1 Tax=Rhizoctonia solani TaxID=456999 RepID=A0A0K6GEN1_9AGAM|nr:hypothetical protein RSOLAG22IIIB_06394 [Rhizoctonia solani]